MHQIRKQVRSKEQDMILMKPSQPQPLDTISFRYFERKSLRMKNEILNGISN